jgi:molybdate transport system substrate-binding protein
MRASAIVLAMLAMARPAAAETVQLYAAGMPEKLAVGAEYGLTVINGGPPSAQRFADFILSSEAQKILTSHGFSPGR